MTEETITELENPVEIVEQVVKEKLLTQAEVDEIVKKRLGRESRKIERELREQLEAEIAARPPVLDKPVKNENESIEDFTERLIDWKDQQKQLEKSKEVHQKAAKSHAERAEKAYELANKLPEFNEEEFNSLLDENWKAEIIKPEFIRALVDSDKAPELMAYLTLHPNEFENLEGLSPHRQAAYVGKLEAKLEKQINAKEPMTPIKGNSTNETNDIMRMTPDQYREYRKKQGASWAQ